MVKDGRRTLALIVGVAGLAALSSVVVSTATAAPAPIKATATLQTTAPAVVAEISSPAQFAVALLRHGQWPVSGSNVCAMMAWEAAEGGHFINGASRYNPINTTQSMPGDSIFNSVGVRNYPDWSTGVAATLKTLGLGFYDGIRTALAAGDDASAVLAAVSQSPWGTKFEGGTGVSGQCLDWAADFDEQRKAALAEIAAADGAVAQTAPRLDAANKAQANLAIKYDAMQAEINKARAQLAVFARSLYIVGVEPEIVSKLQAVQSGDPVAYSLLRSYPGLSANRDADAINRSLGLLAEVGASKQHAADAVALAQTQIQSAQARKAKADEHLVAIERDSLPD